MDQNFQNNSSTSAQSRRESAEVAGQVPHGSETFGKFPHASEMFRNVPNDSEPSRIVPQNSERKENHTLTVREATRLFETAGVARTERSIVNWCQLNAQGVARLDAYFDPNERKYYITAQSVERAVQEELAKAAKVNEPPERAGTIPKVSEEPQRTSETGREARSERVQELEKEVMDLKITNRAKDFFIDQLKGEREHFAQERNGYVEKLMNFNHKLGELETRLLRLNMPSENNGQNDTEKNNGLLAKN